MTDHDAYISEHLFRYSEIDWKEDRLILTIRSDAKFDPVSEAAAWGRVLAETGLAVIGKISAAYDLEEQKSAALSETMKRIISTDLERLCAEQYSIED